MTNTNCNITFVQLQQRIEGLIRGKQDKVFTLITSLWMISKGIRCCILIDETFPTSVCI